MAHLQRPPLEQLFQSAHSPSDLSFSCAHICPSFPHHHSQVSRPIHADHLWEGEAQPLVWGEMTSGLQVPVSYCHAVRHEEQMFQVLNPGSPEARQTLSFVV